MFHIDCHVPVSVEGSIILLTELTSSLRMAFSALSSCKSLLTSSNLKCSPSSATGERGLNEASELLLLGPKLREKVRISKFIIKIGENQMNFQTNKLITNGKTIIMNSVIYFALRKNNYSPSQITVFFVIVHALFDMTRIFRESPTQ